RIATILTTQFGVPAVAVHSKMSSTANDEAIEAYRKGKVRAIVGMNKLTTGFDHKPIDLIGSFRGTLSVPLWVQLLGRGTRPYDFRTERDQEMASTFQYK